MIRPGRSITNLALMQLAAHTRMWGITFLVSWCAAAVNWAWECGFAWPAIRRGIVIYGGLLLLVLLFGSARMGFAIHRWHRARAWHYSVGYAAELA